MKSLKSFFKDESGATMVEYALLVALISVAAGAIILAVGSEVKDAFQSVENCLKTPGSCT